MACISLRNDANVLLEENWKNQMASKYTDLVFILDNKTKIEAHAFVLSSFSTIIRNLMKTRRLLMFEKLYITLMDVKEHMLKNMLKFIYTGEANHLDENDYAEFEILADLLQIHDVSATKSIEASSMCLKTSDKQAENTHNEMKIVEGPLTNPQNNYRNSENAKPKNYFSAISPEMRVEAVESSIKHLKESMDNTVGKMNSSHYETEKEVELIDVSENEETFTYDVMSKSTDMTNVLLTKSVNDPANNSILHSISEKVNCVFCDVKINVSNTTYIYNHIMTHFESELEKMFPTNHCEKCMKSAKSIKMNHRHQALKHGAILKLMPESFVKEINEIREKHGNKTLNEDDDITDTTFSQTSNDEKNNTLVTSVDMAKNTSSHQSILTNNILTNEANNLLVICRYCDRKFTSNSICYHLISHFEDDLKKLCPTRHCQECNQSFKTLNLQFRHVVFKHDALLKLMPESFVKEINTQYYKQYGRELFSNETIMEGHRETAKSVNQENVSQNISENKIQTRSVSAENGKIPRKREIKKGEMKMAHIEDDGKQPNKKCPFICFCRTKFVHLAELKNHLFNMHFCKNLSQDYSEEYSTKICSICGLKQPYGFKVLNHIALKHDRIFDYLDEKTLSKIRPHLSEETIDRLENKTVVSTHKMRTRNSNRIKGRTRGLVINESDLTHDTTGDSTMNDSMNESKNLSDNRFHARLGEKLSLAKSSVKKINIMKAVKTLSAKNNNKNQNNISEKGSKDLLKCPHCPKSFIASVLYLYHQIKTHYKKNFEEEYMKVYSKNNGKCPECSHKSHNPLNFFEHLGFEHKKALEILPLRVTKVLQMGSPEPKPLCLICECDQDRKFSSYEKFKQHIFRNHLSAKIVSKYGAVKKSCPICKEQLKNNSDTYEHIGVHHEKIFDFCSEALKKQVIENGLLKSRPIPDQDKVQSEAALNKKSTETPQSDVKHVARKSYPSDAKNVARKRDVSNNRSMENISKKSEIQRNKSDSKLILGPNSNSLLETSSLQDSQGETSSLQNSSPATPYLFYARKSSANSGPDNNQNNSVSARDNSDIDKQTTLLTSPQLFYPKITSTNLKPLKNPSPNEQTNNESLINGNLHNNISNQHPLFSSTKINESTIKENDSSYTHNAGNETSIEDNSMDMNFSAAAEEYGLDSLDDPEITHYDDDIFHDMNDSSDD